MDSKKINLTQYSRKAVKQFLKKMDNHQASNLLTFVVDEIEKGIILEVLDFTQGNQSKSAQILGITRTTLRNKIKKHQLNLS